MNIQIVGELEFKILNKKGELERLFKKPIDSLLYNFVAEVWREWSNTTVQMYDTTTTARNVSPASAFRTDGPATNNLYGLLLGTGTNPVTINDFNLQTKIAHGNEAGKLYHQITTLAAPMTIGSEAYFTLSRNFNNNSGSTITVQEAGIIAYYATGPWYFMLARDLTGAIEVLTGKTLAALYTFKVTA